MLEGLKPRLGYPIRELVRVEVVGKAEEVAAMAAIVVATAEAATGVATVIKISFNPRRGSRGSRGGSLGGFGTYR